MHSFRTARGNCSEFGSRPLRVPILLEVLRSSPRHAAGSAAQGRAVTQQGRLLGSSQPPLAPTEGRIQFKVAVVTVFKALPGIRFSYQETCLSLYGYHLPQELHSAARLELLEKCSLQTIEASGLLFVPNKILLLSEVLHGRVFWP